MPLGGKQYMSFSTKQCTDTEVFIVETQWQSEGFRLVSKTNDKDLLPHEYLKTSYRGDRNSFDGPRTLTLTRRNPD